MTDLDQWVLVFMAVATPSVFICACLYSKPHVFHIWEINRAAGIKPQEGNQKK